MNNSNSNDNINLINNNNFFSNTYPDLIGEKTFSDLNKLVIVENTSIKENKNLINSSFNLYKKYIQPNLLPIIIIIIFIVFMIYRYMTSKKDSDKKNKKKSSRKKNNVNPDVVQQINENIDENIQQNIDENIQQNIDNLNNIISQPSIDDVIDTIIEKNDDILDDDEIYELMTENNNNDINDNDNNGSNYINFVEKSDKSALDEANKKIFS